VVTTSEGRLAWVSDLIACLYFGWLYLVLARHTSTFVGAFEGLGAQLPASTAFLVRHYWWFYPAFLGGAGVFVVAKEWWIRDKRVSTALTFTVALLVQAITDHCREMLFRPLLDIMQKLS
jgi:hypothetical protein